MTKKFRWDQYELDRYCMDMGHEYRDHVCVRCNDHDRGYVEGQCDHDWHFHEVTGVGIFGYPETTKRTRCADCRVVFDPDVTPPHLTTGELNSKQQRNPLPGDRPNVSDQTEPLGTTVPKLDAYAGGTGADHQGADRLTTTDREEVKPMLDEQFEWLEGERERLLKLIDEESQRSYMDSQDLVAIYQRQLTDIDAQIADLRANT